MAKVILHTDATSENVAMNVMRVLEKDDVSHVWQIDASCNIIEISKGANRSFSVEKSNNGLEYYATIIDKFDGSKAELAEHYVESENGIQINIFGYFASASNAAKNLLRFGNTTKDKRKPLLIYK